MTEALRSVEQFKASAGPEVEFLLCCARLDLPEKGRRRIQELLAGTLDWTVVMALAQRHGLRPLLYRHLNMLGPAAIPRAMFAELWANYESNARRNQAMARALLDVLRRLNKCGIAAIPYKGPSLAEDVYGDLALREFGDLDILLRPRDVLPAQRVLQAHGYVLEYDLKPEVEAAFLRSHLNYHLVLFHDVGPVMVELHWKTDADFPVEPRDDERWWANLGTASLCGETIRCFTREELLLILFLHGTKHAWSSLGWLVDVAELVRRHPDIEWDWITGKAERLSCQLRLGVGLCLANHLLEMPLPHKIKSKIEGLPRVRRLAAEILSMLFNASFDEMNAFERLRFNLSLYDRSWQKITHGTSVVLEPSLLEWSRWPLPRYLHGVYLPLRFARLLAKYVGQAIDRR